VRGSERLRQADKAVDEWMRMHMRCSQSNRYVPHPDMSDVRVKLLPNGKSRRCGPLLTGSDRFESRNVSAEWNHKYGSRPCIYRSCSYIRERDYII
jgi:hypothetical protein